MSEPFSDLTPPIPPQAAFEPLLLDRSTQRSHASLVSASAELYMLSKVTVPPVRARAVSRSLQLKLSESRVPLTLLVAGAGYGKTTLLSHWAHTTPGHVAWLTLESLESEPLRFWSYVLLALRTSLPSLEARVWTELAASDVKVLPTRLVALLNTLLVQNEDVTLILDDYQVIEESSIHQSLLFLVAHAPACFRLCLASRIDPALSLARLRARGQVVEIREAQFLLSLQEAEQFLGQTMGLTLPPGEVQALMHRTEGWIAGLQLAALALRAQTLPSIQHIRGDHRYLVEYVQEDILERVHQATRTFLQEVSILDQMTAALCQAVTGEETSAEHLLALEQANLFVTSLDAQRRGFRLHPLIREALLAQMHAQEPERLTLLHRRAAQWYAEQRLFPEAITHALASHAFALAADLIEQSVQPQSWRNAYHTLRRWLSRLPDDVLHARPSLCFLAAEAHFMTTPIDVHSMPMVQAFLGYALQGYQQGANPTGIGSVRAFQAALLAFSGCFEETIARAQEALTLLPETDVQWRGHALSALGLGALLEGSLDRVQELLQQALVCHEASGHLGGKQFVTLLHAEIHCLQGDYARAAHGFRQVLGLTALDPDQAQAQLTDTLGKRRAHFEYAAWYGLAGMFFEENRLEAAAQALANALVEGQFALLHVLSPGLLLQVRLLLARGEEEAAHTLLEQLFHRPQPPSVMRDIQYCQAYLALRRGDRGQVASWAAGVSTQGPALSHARAVEEDVLLARWYLSEREEEAAERVLVRLLAEVQAKKCHSHTLQVQIIQALVFQRRGSPAAARKALRSAVSIASSAGSHRLFLDEGEEIAHLLRELVSELRHPEQRAYVRTLLRAVPATPHKTLPRTLGALQDGENPLTPQEQRVLRLLAEGASNQQIASVLVISVSAVKKHVSHLLAKLHAENRTQAIARARNLHLLSQPPHQPLT